MCLQYYTNTTKEVGLLNKLFDSLHKLQLRIELIIYF